MDLLYDILQKFWLDIIFIILLMTTLMILYKRRRMDLIKQIILSLVIQAERSFGRGQGRIKYAIVVEQLYQILPISVKWLISREEIDDMIEHAVENLKDYLELETDN